MKTIKDLKNKKVVIMGLGKHGGGLSSAQFMAKAGAKVLVTDLKKEDDLKEPLELLKEFKNIQYVLGQHRIEDFKKADLIIKNPAVSENSKHLQVARDHKVPIKNSLELFFELCPAPIIGIINSSGKLIREILKKKFQNVLLSQTGLDIFYNIKKGSLVILELDKSQLPLFKTYQNSEDYLITTPDEIGRIYNISESDIEKAIAKYAKKLR